MYALCCDGIDTVADIFINGMLIKHVDNMHLRYRILCTNVLKNGTNNITVKIHSAIAYVNEHVPAAGKEIHYTACGAMEGKSVYPESTFHVWLGLGSTVTGYGDLA